MATKSRTAVSRVRALADGRRCSSANGEAARIARRTDPGAGPGAVVAAERIDRHPRSRPTGTASRRTPASSTSPSPTKTWRSSMRSTRPEARNVRSKRSGG